MPGEYPLDQATATLRPAQPDDVGALIQLLRRSWLWTMAPHLPSVSRERFETIDPVTSYVEAMGPEFMVAELDGKPVGMCHVQGDLVAAIHVDPALKRQGIGRELMDWATREIGGGHSVARLEVLAFNEGARCFYEALGWREARTFSGEEMGCSVELVELHLELDRCFKPDRGVRPAARAAC